MPCYHPLTGYQSADGQVHFVERSGPDHVRTLSLPCGRCIGCRLERTRQWAVRCMHEAKVHDQNCFVTLTYDDAHLPGPSLVYADFQRFMKRLRKAMGRTRFFMCGEYGPELGRPHFHAILFGINFADRKPWKKTDSGGLLYRSSLLEKLWPFGFSTIGAVTFESAAYVAGYCSKKITGDLADVHYKRLDPDTGELVQLEPEFGHMSLKPGIGAGWIDKWSADVYPRDQVIVRGRPAKPPRFYDKRQDEETMEAVKFARATRGRERYADNTPERLLVREQVAQGRGAIFPRKLN
ncbi:MAG: replication initiator protein [Microvirus sp.]|nr:MAG: replication initiator protein [Microvirus sp.]